MAKSLVGSPFWLPPELLVGAPYDQSVRGPKVYQILSDAMIYQLVPGQAGGGSFYNCRRTLWIRFLVFPFPESFRTRTSEPKGGNCAARPGLKDHKKDSHAPAPHTGFSTQTDAAPRRRANRATACCTGTESRIHYATARA